LWIVVANIVSTSAIRLGAKSASPCAPSITARVPSAERTTTPASPL
jgi:hypothetical protein